LTRIKFQIEELRKVLKYAGSPHETIPVVSVAGTNGKGSVSAFLESIIRNCGRTTGLFTSPHIFKFTERIKVNGKSIAVSEFKKVLKAVREAQSKANADLTGFEIMTAAAVIYFNNQKCDFCIMEAGLGGRLDATNVCENKLASVITSVSLEHTQYLGTTIEEIAREKAGIIKPAGKVVDASGTGEIRKTALALDCSVYSEGQEYKVSRIQRLSGGYYAFSYESDMLSIDGVVPSLRGRLQCYNAAAAITTALLVGQNETNCVRNGIEKSRLPGRLELKKINGKYMLADAAHNPAGIKQLADFLYENVPAEKVFGIMCVYKDKDYREMARIISPGIKTIRTFTPKNERGLDGKILAGIFGKKAVSSESFEAAYKESLKEMKKGDWLAVFGSFEAVQPALRIINET